MPHRLIGILVFLGVAQIAFADTTAVTADGRKVILHDNGKWSEATESGKKEGDPVAMLTLEKKSDLARGCRLGLRLQNDLQAQIRTLVLRFTAYKGEKLPFETVSRGYSYIKPTASQYQEIDFRGITCGEIVSIGVEAARNCHVGALTKYSADEKHCLKLIEVAPSTIVPIAKKAEE